MPGQSPIDKYLDPAGLFIVSVVAILSLLVVYDQWLLETLGKFG